MEPYNTDISELDTYFFTLAFLYRHSIELKLKAIAFQNIISNKDRSDLIKEKGHNLSGVFEELKPFSTFLVSEDELNWLENYFSDLSEIDRDSDSFRYPFKITWKKILDVKTYNIERVFDEQTHVNLVKFVNKFEAVYEILDKWYSKSLDSTIAWKELEPVFIEDGDAYYIQSVVGYKYSRNHYYPYVSAYLETANYLRRFMEENIDLEKNSEISDLFLPMCYLYRNAVELNLKMIWFEETKVDFQKRCESMVKINKHSIEKMWNLIKPYIETDDFKSIDEDYIKILKDYCEQLHRIDPDSNKFRYPVNKHMMPYFKTNKRFDFMNTGIFLESLNNGLSGISMMLNVANEYKLEMKNECC